MIYFFTAVLQQVVVLTDHRDATTKRNVSKSILRIHHVISGKMLSFIKHKVSRHSVPPLPALLYIIRNYSCLESHNSGKRAADDVMLLEIFYFSDVGAAAEVS